MGWRDAPRVDDEPETGGEAWRQAPVEEGPSVLRDVAKSAASGVGELLNVPQQAVDWGAEKLGVEIPRGPRLIDFHEPETRAGAASRTGAQALAATIPVVGPAARGAGTAAQAARMGQQAAQAGAGGRLAAAPGRMAQEAAHTAVRAPKTFFGVEAGLGGLAGLGGHEAQRMYPDEPAAQAIGEILGGMGPALAITGGKMAVKGAHRMAERTPLTGAIMRKGAQVARQLRDTTTLRGSQRRATERFRRAARDRDEARYALDAEDRTLPEAQLTPAQRTGDRGLLELEKAVMSSTDQLRNQADEQLASVNQVVRQSLQEMGEGVSPERTRETFEAARGYMSSLMDARMRAAAQRADERMAEAGPSLSRQDANRIAREEIERALRDTRRQERELYNAIPQDAEVPTDATLGRFRSLVGDLSRAQRDDIPATANRMLNRDSNDFLGDRTTLREMRGVQVKLREEAQRARANNEMNTARIADELRDAITEDIANIEGGEEIQEAVRLATSFSRDRAQRFNQGQVGRLLGRDQTGGARVEPALTLETSLGGESPRAAEHLRQMTEAVRTNPTQLRGAAEDYVRNRFMRAAVRDGRVDPERGQAFLRNNEDLLNEMHGTKRAIEEAISSGQTRALREAQRDSVANRLGNPRISRTALFIEQEPAKAFETILKSRHPARQARSLVNMTHRDDTGDALKGLKTAFAERLLSKASTRQADVGDVEFLSGQKLQRELENENVQQVMQVLFSPEEMQRIDQIRETALRMDRARTAQPAQEGVIGDTPGMITDMIARVGGAQIGRILARHTGGGTVQTPGILAGRARQALESRVQDPAKRLLTDAITSEDPELFRALLIGIDTPDPHPVVRRQLNAWMAGVLDDLGEPVQQEEEGGGAADPWMQQPTAR